MPIDVKPSFFSQWRSRKLATRRTRRQAKPPVESRNRGNSESDSKTPTSWLKALDPGKRRALGALHSIQPIWNLVALLYPLLGLAGAIAINLFPVWPVRIAGFVVIGISIHAMAVLVHEASHYSIFRNRKLDRWIGFLMGVPVLVSCSAYRVLHGYHHRFTREMGDPDEFKNVTDHRLLLSIFFYSWLIIGTPVYLIHVAITAFKNGSRKDRIDVSVEYALLVVICAAVYATLRHYHRTDLIVSCWAYPMVLAMIFGNIRSWAEHAMTIPGNPLTSTRTVTSNRIVSFLMCNLNYHLEHHLLPGIPWYNLQKIHALLQPEFKAANSFIYRSYWRFLYDAFRNGVHGISWAPFPMM